uniref:Uncharacterized protein n=1 Tax=Acrobeloides nanus TaxID=290746 RepID=A0A914C316_9BILA
MKLFLILAFLSCVSIGHGKLDSEPESSLTQKLNKRSVQDYRTLSSAEFEQQRYNIEAELRHLNHRRKRRYDNDRQCCGRCEEDDCNCCQRLVNQPCPYTVSNKCGIPEPILPIVRNESRVRTFTKRYNVSKIVTVTDSPIDYQLIEQRLIQNLEQEIRELRQHEEKKQIDYENKLRLEFEQLLPGSEVVDDTILRKLEIEIQNLRQHWPVSNPQQRRVILENHISEQRRQNDLNLNLWEERRRDEFQTLLNDLKFKHGKPPRNIEVNFEVVEKETIHEHERHETIRQECCNRCAPQDCTPVRRPCQNCPDRQPCNNCPAPKPACPVVDNCRCNHAFVSCEY